MVSIFAISTALGVSQLENTIYGLHTNHRESLIFASPIINQST